MKPCSFDEVTARVMAVLRRARPTHCAETLLRGSLTIHVSRRTVTHAGSHVPLTASEFRLLYTLASAPGRVFTRQELIASLYNRRTVVVDRVVDVHLANLRQKLAEKRSDCEYIQTVRGHGYRFVDND